MPGPAKGNGSRIFTSLSVDVAAAEDLDHLAAQAVADGEALAGRNLVDVSVEEVILERQLLDEHARVVEIGLVEVDVHGVVAVERRGLDELLDGCHLGVHEELAAVQVAREAAHAVIHRDDVRIELRDHVVKRLER